MRVEETFTVKTRGVGAPDYSNTVSSAKERRGIRLGYLQQLKMYGRNRTPADADYPFIPASPLAPGASVHLCDAETLVDMPIIIPVGYTLSMIAIGHTFDQDARVIAYLDSLLAYCFAMTAGGMAFYENKIIGVSTALYDPTAANSHTFDIKLFNMGTSNLYGSVSVDCVLEAVGTTPFPTTKECQCPHCGNRQIESVHATTIKCNACGKIYIVYDLTQLRETP